MTQAFSLRSQSETRIALQVPSLNTAIAKCQRDWKRTYRTSLKEFDSLAIAGLDASDAYRAALPPLDSRKNIRDFIACIGHAMVTDIFIVELGTMLLNAAQVAMRAAEPLPKTTAPTPAPDSKTPDPTPLISTTSGQNPDLPLSHPVENRTEIRQVIDPGQVNFFNPTKSTPKTPGITPKSPNSPRKFPPFPQKSPAFPKRRLTNER
jgi:hypothetical protein